MRTKKSGGLWIALAAVLASAAGAAFSSASVAAEAAPDIIFSENFDGEINAEKWIVARGDPVGATLVDHNGSKAWQPTTGKDIVSVALIRDTLALDSWCLEYDLTMTGSSNCGLVLNHDNSGKGTYGGESAWSNLSDGGGAYYGWFTDGEWGAFNDYSDKFSLEGFSNRATHHVKCVYYGEAYYFSFNGVDAFSIRDGEYTGGYLGFRTQGTTNFIDNIVLRKQEAAPAFDGVYSTRSRSFGANGAAKVTFDLKKSVGADVESVRLVVTHVDCYADKNDGVSKSAEVTIAGTDFRGEIIPVWGSEGWRAEDYSFDVTNFVKNASSVKVSVQAVSGIDYNMQEAYIVCRINGKDYVTDFINLNKADSERAHNTLLEGDFYWSGWLTEKRSVMRTDDTTVKALPLTEEDEVAVKIAAIGAVELTEESKAKIDAARAAYDALSDAGKACVDGAALIAAEEKYAELTALGKVAVVKDKIAAIGEVSYSSASWNRIKAARTEYDLLPEEQKSGVDNYGVLTAAEAAYAAIAEGAVFAEDFEKGRNDEDWTYAVSASGTGEIIEEGGNKKWRVAFTDNESQQLVSLIQGTEGLENYSIEFEFGMNGASNAGLVFAATAHGIGTYGINSSWLNLGDRGYINYGYFENGEWGRFVELAAAKVNGFTGTGVYTIKVRVYGGILYTSVNGQDLVAIYDPDLTKGLIGFRHQGTTNTVDNILVKEITEKPAFTGAYAYPSRSFGFYDAEGASLSAELAVINGAKLTGAKAYLLHQQINGVDYSKIEVSVNGTPLGTWAECCTTDAGTSKTVAMDIPLETIRGNNKMTVTVTAKGQDFNLQAIWAECVYDGQTYYTDCVLIGNTASENAHGVTLQGGAENSFYYKSWQYAKPAAGETEVLFPVPRTVSTEEDAVIAAIEAIGTVAYTEECKAKIDAAQTAYDALSAESRACVRNGAALTAAAAKYAELKQRDIDRTIALIEEIGEVTYSVYSRNLIDTAQAAYDALDDAQKAGVSNYEVLQAAEEAYKAERQAGIDRAERLIGEIGKVEKTESCRIKIADARSAYNALDDGQKGEVENYAVLEKAEADYAALQAPSSSVPEESAGTSGGASGSATPVKGCFSSTALGGCALVGLAAAAALLVKKNKGTKD